MNNQANSQEIIPLSFIGFGEAAQAFTRGWAEAGQDNGLRLSLAAYDIKTDAEDAAIRDAKLADYDSFGVRTGKDSADAVSGSRAVFSLVTADQAFAVAEKVSGSLTPGQLYFDCNSCAPGTKRRSAALIEGAGGHYVDCAVMAPVHPKLHKTPLLLSGPHSSEGLDFLNSLDMNAKRVEGDVGSSSAIKMVRSVMMKGLEALFLECVLAGRKAGVDETVLASLDQTWPGFDFPGKAGYMFERAMTHGVRRAAEMREVALTVDELGLTGRMARATAEWEQQIGELKEAAGEAGDYRPLADSLLQRLLSGGDD